MAKNPGQMFEIIDGTYKGKFCIAYNKKQIEHYSKQGRLVVLMFEDILCTKKFVDKISGKQLLSIIHKDKLKLIGFVD